MANEGDQHTLQLPALAITSTNIVVVCDSYLCLLSHFLAHSATQSLVLANAGAGSCSVRLSPTEHSTEEWTHPFKT